MGRTTILALAGAKGGVGKTTTSINLSTVLGRTGKSTLFVELDLATANVGDSLRLDADPSLEENASLLDVLSGHVPVEEAIYPSPEGLDVLPCSTDLDDFAKADPERLPEVFEELRGTYDVIVVDTPAGLGRPMVHAASHADATILVSTLRLASVRDVEKTRDFADRLGSEVVGVVFIGPETKRSPPVEKIAAYLDVELLAHIPHDHAVPTAQDIRRPVVECQPGSVAAETYRAVGSELYDRIWIDRTIGPDETDEQLSPGGEGPGGFEFVDDEADDEPAEHPPEDLVLTIDEDDLETDTGGDADADGDAADADGDSADADGDSADADGDAAAEETVETTEASAVVDAEIGDTESVTSDPATEPQSKRPMGPMEEDLVLNLDEEDDADGADAAADADETEAPDSDEGKGADSPADVDADSTRPEDTSDSTRPEDTSDGSDPHPTAEDLVLDIEAVEADSDAKGPDDESDSPAHGPDADVDEAASTTSDVEQEDFELSLDEEAPTVTDDDADAPTSDEDSTELDTEDADSPEDADTPQAEPNGRVAEEEDLVLTIDDADSEEDVDDANDADDGEDGEDADDVDDGEDVDTNELSSDDDTAADDTRAGVGTSPDTAGDAGTGVDLSLDTDTTASGQQATADDEVDIDLDSNEEGDIDTEEPAEEVDPDPTEEVDVDIPDSDERAHRDAAVAEGVSPPADATTDPDEGSTPSETGDGNDQQPGSSRTEPTTVLAADDGETEDGGNEGNERNERHEGESAATEVSDAGETARVGTENHAEAATPLDEDLVLTLEPTDLTDLSGVNTVPDEANERHTGENEGSVASGRTVEPNDEADLGTNGRVADELQVEENGVEDTDEASVEETDEGSVEETDESSVEDTDEGDTHEDEDEPAVADRPLEQSLEADETDERRAETQNEETGEEKSEEMNEDNDDVVATAKAEAKTEATAEPDERDEESADDSTTSRGLLGTVASYFNR